MSALATAIPVAPSAHAPAVRGNDEPAPGTRAALYQRRHKPLGDPAPLACTVAKAALESVLGGDTLGSLTRWLAPDVRTSLAKQHSLARRAGRSGAPTVSIARARVCRVTARAAEVSIVASCQGRVRAIAMRLEDASGRWLVTALEVG